MLCSVETVIAVEITPPATSYLYTSQYSIMYASMNEYNYQVHWTHLFTLAFQSMPSARRPPATSWSWWRSLEPSGPRTPSCPKCWAWPTTPTTSTGWPLCSASTWVDGLVSARASRGHGVITSARFVLYRASVKQLCPSLPLHWKCKGNVLIAVYLFIYLYACSSHNSKNIKPNRMKFGGMIGYYPWTIWVDFAIDRIKGQG